MLVAGRHNTIWLLFIMALSGLLLVVGCRGDSSGTTSGPHTSQPYEGTELNDVAPDFQLTDQNGVAVALSDFRGRVVVLAFMDTRCDETCPLTAFELRTAYQSLGDFAEQAVFLGVNVNINFNINFNTPEDALAFTRKFNLDEMPTWHFLTGTKEQLPPVWKAYFIGVRPEPGEDDFEHTPGVYVIDWDGDLQ